MGISRRGHKGGRSAQRLLIYFGVFFFLLHFFLQWCVPSFITRRVRPPFSPTSTWCHICPSLLDVSLFIFRNMWAHQHRVTQTGGRTHDASVFPLHIPSGLQCSSLLYVPLLLSAPRRVHPPVAPAFPSSALKSKQLLLLMWCTCGASNPIRQQPTSRPVML